MIITLTGTPGTGKTTIANKLEEKGYNVIHLTEYLEQENIGEMVNEEREVPINEMVETIQNEDLPEKTIIEGHLSHHIPSDISIILRCQPDKLRQRLSKRDYSEQKIKENIEAEKLDIILQETVQKQETIIEINTTNKNIQETVKEISRRIDSNQSHYGNIEWI